MALDSLPDRPLTIEEFHAIRAQDAFEEVYTSDTPGDVDTLVLVDEDGETTLHYTEERGWHRHDH